MGFFILRIYDLLNHPLDEDWKKWVMAGVLGAGLHGLPAYAKSSPAEPEQLAALPNNSLRSHSIQALTNSPFERQLLLTAQAAGIRGAELAALMAQARHETENFTRMKERGGSLDFRKYDPVHNPARAKILGNIRPGDGARYAGRGFLHITGRYWYNLLSQELGVDLIKRPHLLEDPKIAARATIWFWKRQVRPKVANWKDVSQVTRRVHPGLRALPERERYFRDYLATM